MKFKNTLLLGIFVILLGSYVYFYEIKGEAKREEEREKAKKIFLLEKENVTDLTLKKSGEEPYVFKKDGENWKIQSPVEYKGDKDQINNLIEALVDAERERAISEDIDFSLFGLAEQKSVINFKSSGLSDSLSIGKKNPTGSYVFVRKGNDSEVILTPTRIFNMTDKKLYDFRDKTILDFSRDAVNRITRLKENGKIVLKRDFGKNFEIIEPGKYEAEPSEVVQVLNKINNSDVKEFIDEKPVDLKKYGLDKPYIRLELLVGEDNAQKTLIVGNKEGNKYYIKDTSKDPVFKVEEDVVKKLDFTLFTVRLKDIFKFERDSINKIELICADNSIVCEKDTLDNWFVLSDTAKVKAVSWRVNGIVRGVNSLKAQKFLEDVKTDLKKWGILHPQVTCRFYKDNALYAHAVFGNKEEDNVYMEDSLTKRFFLVRNTILNDLLTTVDKLIEK